MAPFDITFAPHTAIKSQALANFITKWTPSPQAEEQPPSKIEAPWTIYTDESWCAKGAGATAILVAPDGRSMSHAARLDFPATNNASKYEALLLGLRKARALGVRGIIVKSCSRLMAGHFDKSFTARDPKMARYLASMCAAAKRFLGITIQNHPKSQQRGSGQARKAGQLRGATPTRCII